MENTQSFWLRSVSLALPIALQTLLQAMLGMADVAMTSHLGSNAIASIGLAAKLHFLLFVIMTGLATASSVLIAQYYGAKKFERCRETLAMSLLIGVFSTLPFFFVFGIFSSSWLRFINPDADIVMITSEYLRITAPVLLLTQVIVIYESGLRSLGNTTAPLVIGATAVGMNILLNYVLIFGHWGFTERGVEGAAVATVIARTIQLTLIILWVYGSKHGLALNWSCYRKAFAKTPILTFIGFASPVVINHIFWGLGNTLYHVLSGFSGNEVLAVLGMMVPIEVAFLSLFIGISGASAIMIGQALGANQHDLAWRLSRFFEKSCLFLVLSLSFIVWLCKDFVIAAFDGIDPVTQQYFSTALTCFCLLIWLRAMNMYRIVGVLRAGGDNNFCLRWDLSAIWLFGIPLYALAVWYGNLPFYIFYGLLFADEFVKYAPVRKRIKEKLWMTNLTEEQSDNCPPQANANA